MTTKIQTPNSPQIDEDLTDRENNSQFDSSANNSKFDFLEWELQFDTEKAPFNKQQQPSPNIKELPTELSQLTPKESHHSTHKAQSLPSHKTLTFNMNKMKMYQSLR